MVTATIDVSELDRSLQDLTSLAQLIESSLPTSSEEKSTEPNAARITMQELCLQAGSIKKSIDNNLAYLRKKFVSLHTSLQVAAKSAISHVTALFSTAKMKGRSRCTSRHSTRSGTKSSSSSSGSSDGDGPAPRCKYSPLSTLLVPATSIQEVRQ